MAGQSRSVTPEELEEVKRRIGEADFNRRLKPVPRSLLGREFESRRLGAEDGREDSLTVHLAQRVLNDEQWSRDTTREEFLEDLHRTALHPEASVAVYETRGTSIVAVVAPNAVPGGRQRPARGEYVIVIYSADRGRINSGWQTSDPRGNIPARARWLRRQPREES